MFDAAGADLQSVLFLTGICNANCEARKGKTVKPGNFRNCQALLFYKASCCILRFVIKAIINFYLYYGHHRPWVALMSDDAPK
jgi:hypothetical protein